MSKIKPLLTVYLIEATTIVPFGVEFCASLVQRVVVIVAKHFKHHGVVLQVANERRIHWHTDLDTYSNTYII